MLAILIPTFGRAAKLPELVKQIKAATKVPHTVYFIIEKHDQDTINVCKRKKLTHIFNMYEPGYAGAINTAYEETSEQYLFAGGDDLEFMPGWDTAAFAALDKGYLVAGTNDLLNKDVLAGHHATHYLVDRKYLDTMGGCADFSYPFLYQYHHNYTDREFIETAQARGVFIMAMDSVVKHKHWEGDPKVWDKTYQKNERYVRRDRLMYESRRHLWTPVN